MLRVNLMIVAATAGLFLLIREPAPEIVSRSAPNGNQPVGAMQLPATPAAPAAPYEPKNDGFPKWVDIGTPSLPLMWYTDRAVPTPMRTAKDRSTFLPTAPTMKSLGFIPPTEAKSISVPNVSGQLSRVIYGQCYVNGKADFTSEWAAKKTVVAFEHVYGTTWWKARDDSVFLNNAVIIPTSDWGMWMMANGPFSSSGGQGRVSPSMDFTLYSLQHWTGLDDPSRRLDMRFTESKPLP